MTSCPPPAATDLSTPPTLCPAARARPRRVRAAGDRRRGDLRRPRLRRQRPRAPAGVGRRGRVRPLLRQRAPRRRLPLAALHRPVRAEPGHRRRVPRLPRRRPGGLHPLHHRLAQPAGRRRCRPAPRSSSSRPSTTPRCCRGAGEAPRVTYLDAPRTPEQAVATLDVALHGAPEGPQAGLRHRRVQRHRRAVAGTRTGRRRAPRTAPGSCSTPPSSPRTTRSTSPSSTSTGSPSPATSCTRPSAPGCSPGGPTGCATPSRTWPAAAPPARSPGGADGGVDVEWHDGRRPARGRLAQRHRRLRRSPRPARRSPRPASTAWSPASSSCSAGCGPGSPRSPRCGCSRSSATTPPGSASSPSSSRAGTARTSRRRSPRSTASASATASSAPTRWSARCSAATREEPGECGAPEAAPGERSLNAIRVSFGAGTPDEHVERFVAAVRELVADGAALDATAPRTAAASRRPQRLTPSPGERARHRPQPVFSPRRAGPGPGRGGRRSRPCPGAGPFFEGRGERRAQPAQGWTGPAARARLLLFVAGPPAGRRLLAQFPAPPGGWTHRRRQIR